MASWWRKKNARICISSATRSSRIHYRCILSSEERRCEANPCISSKCLTSATRFGKQVHRTYSKNGLTCTHITQWKLISKGLWRNRWPTFHKKRLLYKTIQIRIGEQCFKDVRTSSVLSSQGSSPWSSSVHIRVMNVKPRRMQKSGVWVNIVCRTD